MRFFLVPREGKRQSKVQSWIPAGSSGIAYMQLRQALTRLLLGKMWWFFRLSFRKVEENKLSCICINYICSIRISTTDGTLNVFNACHSLVWLASFWCVWVRKLAAYIEHSLCGIGSPVDLVSFSVYLACSTACNSIKVFFWSLSPCVQKMHFWKPSCQRDVLTERQLLDLFQKPLASYKLRWALFIITSSDRAIAFGLD